MCPTQTRDDSFFPEDRDRDYDKQGFYNEFNNAEEESFHLQGGRASPRFSGNIMGLTYLIDYSHGKSIDSCRPLI